LDGGSLTCGIVDRVHVALELLPQRHAHVRIPAHHNPRPLWSATSTRFLERQHGALGTHPHRPIVIKANNLYFHSLSCLVSHVPSKHADHAKYGVEEIAPPLTRHIHVHKHPPARAHLPQIVSHKRASVSGKGRHVWPGLNVMAPGKAELGQTCTCARPFLDKMLTSSYDRDSGPIRSFPMYYMLLALTDTHNGTRPVAVKLTSLNPTTRPTSFSFTCRLIRSRPGVGTGT
jgi:hypothetical protein